MCNRPSYWEHRVHLIGFLVLATDSSRLQKGKWTLQEVSTDWVAIFICLFFSFYICIYLHMFTLSVSLQCLSMLFIEAGSLPEPRDPQVNWPSWPTCPGSPVSTSRRLGFYGGLRSHQALMLGSKDLSPHPHLSQVLDLLSDPPSPSFALSYLLKAVPIK